MLESLHFSLAAGSLYNDGWMVL